MDNFWKETNPIAWHNGTCQASASRSKSLPRKGKPGRLANTNLQALCNLVLWEKGRTNWQGISEEFFRGDSARKWSMDRPIVLLWVPLVFSWMAIKNHPKLHGTEWHAKLWMHLDGAFTAGLHRAGQPVRLTAVMDSLMATHTLVQELVYTNCRGNGFQKTHPAAAVPTTIWQGQLAILNERLQDHNHLKQHLHMLYSYKPDEFVALHGPWWQTCLMALVF